MDKRQRKVLNVLKTKAKQFGFNRSELKGIAAKIADDLDLADDASEEDENSAIDEAVENAMGYLKFSQAAAQRVISNSKKKHETPDEEDEPDDEDKPSEENKGNKPTPKKDKDDDTPAWAKGFIESMNKTVETMSERLSSLEKSNTSKSRRSKLEEKLKDTGRFGERRLKEFDRIKDTFKNDEDFDEYLDEVAEDLEKYNQERADAGLKKLGIPGAGAPGKTPPTPKDDEDKTLSDDDIKALAEQF